LEETLRRTIIEHEFAGRLDELTSLFLKLFDLKLSHADPARLMDVGYALQCAAERTGNEQLQLVACSQRMIACQRAGELRRGLQEFEQLRCGEAMRATRDFIAPLQFAGSFLSLIGSVEQAEAHLRRAMMLCREHGLLPGAARAARGLALAFARNNNYKRAVEILAEEANLIAEAGDTGLIAQSEDLRGRFQRRLSRRESAMPISIGLSQPLRKAALGPDDVPPLRAMTASPEDLLTLARWVLGSDLVQEAHALALEASLLFGDARDRTGIADCLLFLADIAQTQRYWESAYEFGRSAAAVCAQVEDRAREIVSRALTAFCLYRLEEFVEAEKEATRCLLLAKGQPPSRPLLVACYVRAACCDQKGDAENKAMSMFAFLQGFPAVDGVEDLVPLRDSFQRALTPAGTQH
jgi:tetratricopeptide (TPR) repeat protein